MGATVTTGKHVRAFRAEDGTLYYVLFEQTYEKRSYPHDPRWQCICIGNIERALQQVFHFAAVCCGGMLQGRNGELTPEGYIREWLKKLAASSSLVNHPVPLRCGADFGAPIPLEAWPGVAARLGDIGRSDIAAALERNEQVQLILYRDAAVLSAVYAGGDIGPWRVFPGIGPDYAPPVDAGLGYIPEQPSRSSRTRPVVTAEYAKVGDCLLQLNADGTLGSPKHDYEVESDFIRGYWPQELALPGSVTRQVRALRGAMARAQLFCEDVEVDLDRNAKCHTFTKEAIDEFATAYPTWATSDRVVLRYSALDELARWRALRLSADVATWRLTRRSSPLGVNYSTAQGVALCAA